MSKPNFILSLAFTLAAQTLCLATNPSLPEALSAARAGDARAQYIVGMMYLQGQGARQNLPESARWLEQSARAGMPHAIVSLANLYDVGLGVPFDPDRATALRQLAARREMLSVGGHSRVGRCQPRRWLFLAQKFPRCRPAPALVDRPQG